MTKSDGPGGTGVLSPPPAVSAFIRAELSSLELQPGPDPAAEPGAWRRQLSPAQLAEVERIAGDELRRVGYGDAA